MKIDPEKEKAFEALNAQYEKNADPERHAGFLKRQKIGLKRAGRVAICSFFGAGGAMIGRYIAHRIDPADPQSAYNLTFFVVAGGFLAGYWITWRLTDR